MSLFLAKVAFLKDAPYHPYSLPFISNYLLSRGMPIPTVTTFVNSFLKQIARDTSGIPNPPISAKGTCF